MDTDDQMEAGTGQEKAALISQVEVGKERGGEAGEVTLTERANNGQKVSTSEIRYID